MTDIQQAREWAEWADGRRGVVELHANALAAAEIIQSLPDQIIDAEKVREVISKVLASTLHGTVGHQVAEDYAALIGELLPTPPLPTLADMTPDERQSCVGMWCDNLVSTAEEPAPVVLACVQGDLCWILHTGIHGERSCFPLESVAPRFDLMRSWNPDGTPVKMEVQVSEVAYGKVYKGSSHDRVTIPEDTKVRRFIGEWEAANE